LKLLTPEKDMSTYTFNKHFNPIAAINARCVEGFEPSSVPVKHFNGRAL